jgi:TPR repeat protein
MYIAKGHFGHGDGRFVSIPENQRNSGQYLMRPAGQTFQHIERIRPALRFSQHPIAQYNLAMMYSNGESVNVDYQQSVYWFNKSADQGFPPAQHRLGEMYYFGRGGVSRNISRAVSLFLLAAKQNDPDAQMNLAMLYGTGEGVPADTYEAFRWLEKANALGDESATAYQRMLSASDNGKFTVEQHNTFWAEKAEELGLPGKTPYSNRITGS